MRDNQGKLATFAGIILVVVFGIILFMFTTTAILGITKGLDRFACQVSLFAQTPIESASSTFFFAQCPTYDVRITNKKITIHQGKNSEEFTVLDDGRQKKKYSELEEDYVYQVLSEEMRLCWKLFFEGNRDVFRKEWFEFGWKDNTVCFVCSNILFEDITPQKTFTAFEGYLKNNLVPNDPDKRTYYSYVTNTPQHNRYSVEDLQQDLLPDKWVIETNKQYLVTYIKQGESSVYSMVGSTDGNNFMVLAEKSKINEHCKYFVYPANK